MANPLFERFGTPAPTPPAAPTQNPQLLQQIRANPHEYAAQISSNPAAFIKQRFGADIPPNMTDAWQIIQYLFGPAPGRRR